MSPIPLFPETDLNTPFAIRNGAVISRETFHSHVMTLAGALPAEGRILNMCTDRYWFAVALFAAIARGLLTVLPNSAAPEHLAAVAAEQPGLLVLGDQPTRPVEHMPWFRVDTLQPETQPASSASPMIPFDQRIACVYTSGSTGTPTSHNKTFGRLRLAVLAGADRLWDATGGPCSVVGTVPIRHMYGLESSVLLPILGNGVMSTQIPFFPADIASSLAQLPAPRLLVITPFHLRKLIEANIQLPEVAAVLSATAPLSVELAQEVEHLLGCPVIEIYGSTETGQVATRQPVRDTLWYNLDGIRIEELGGETWAVGDIYETPQMLNDTVELVNPTTFRLVDRKANMINVAGKRSSLTFLNQTLSGLAGVNDGVFCLTEQDSNHEVERLVAFVVAPTLTREAILTGLRSYIDPVFLPRQIIFVESLPRDGNGKILARTLQALIRQHIVDRS